MMTITPARILVADDEPEILELLQEVLARQGHEVMTVVEGTEALASVSTFRPDVVIVDITMPGLSGPEVLDALRRAGSEIPVIAISGHPDIVSQAFSAVISKPFSIAAIARAVAVAVGHGGGSG